ncbi:MAG: hypothetical protein ICV65_15460, partial [Flavisolibacter sp.]|nr:hypothetical protein [Flavisolibacter sp.]
MAKAKKTVKASKQKSASKKGAAKTASAEAASASLSQAVAVKKKAEVEIANADFKFSAVPAGFKSELLTDNAIKRFHGSRALFSWLPLEFFNNNKDRFGYMFPSLSRPGASSSVLPYTSENKDRLQRLGDEMGNKDEATQGLPPVTDSTIPAGYTYLGQFIDHDITLDVNSNINEEQNANNIPNMRSPALDLDAIYGQGPFLNPFLYDHTASLGRASGVKLLLGRNQDTGNGGPSLRTGNNNFGNPATIPGGNNFDVQRSSDFTAIIGDPRNDENLIVSQLHHAFIKFHNKVVDHLLSTSFTGDLFTESKKITTHHYQWAVINDYLKKMADPAIVDRTLRDGPRFFTARQFVMPVEFSVAAYRFGHSMIRNDYFVNAPLTGALSGAASLKQVFQFIRVPLLPATSNWVVDFNLFFNARPIPTANGVQFNFTRKIDTRLASGLESLPGETDTLMKMLAKRNLVRGMALRLPSGQAVARAIGATALTEDELQRNNTVTENAILNEAGKLLLKKTPLWYYTLKEAEIRQDGNRLGTVGSTILAETFVRMLREDINSFVHVTSPRFRPSLPRFNSRPAGDYDLADILHFAGVLTLGNGTDDTGP